MTPEFRKITRKDLMEQAAGMGKLAVLFRSTGSLSGKTLRDVANIMEMWEGMLQRLYDQMPPDDVEYIEEVSDGPD